MAVNYTDFYDAQAARQIAIGQRSAANDLLNEINLLQIAVDQAAASGALTVDMLSTTSLTFAGVTVTGSPMTIDAGQVFFNAWSDPAVYFQGQYVAAREKMDTLIGYFVRLGYSIRRYRDGVNNRFKWTIAW